MPTLPHDMIDLQLAPTAIALDARLSELGELSADALRLRVVLASNTTEKTPAERSAALLETVGHLIELHGWEISWDDRGLRMQHGRHTVVLGVPGTFRQYIEQGATP